MAEPLPSPHKTISPIRCSEKPWDLWVSEIGHSSPLRDEHPSAASVEVGKGEPGCRAAPAAARRAPHPGVTRLKLSSMCLYGQFPNTDLLNAAVCYMCGMTVKCSAAHRHLVEYHSSSVDPILPPPPPTPTVKLKSLHTKSKFKKDVPLASAALGEELLPVPPAPVAAPAAVEPHHEEPPRIVLTQQDLNYFPELEVTGQKCPPQSEVKVSVDDNDLPVVSIQDNTDLPLADDIIEIMNSEGIQSIEEGDTADTTDTTDWKTLLKDLAIQEMNSSLLTDGVATHGIYDSNGIPVQMSGATYALAGDESLQYTQPITLTPTLPPGPDSQCGTFPIHPVQCAPVKPKSKPSKPSSKPKIATREYDPNKHCGVLTGEGHKPCTRSLTCKAHTLSLRRLVEGRVKSFDVLLAEHRASKPTSLVSPLPLVINQAPAVHQPSLVSQSIVPNAGSIVNQVSLASQLNSSSPVAVVCSQNTTVAIGLSSPLVVPGTVDMADFADFSSTDYFTSVVEEPAPCSAPVAAAKASPEAGLHLPSPRPGDVCWYASSPRPLAACPFASYHMGSALLLSKRLARVRSSIKTTLVQPSSKPVGGYYNFGQNSLSKTMQVNNAAKPASPEVRKLIMSYPVSGASVKTEPDLYFNPGSRQNGHLYSTKRPLLDDYEDLDSKCLRTAGTSVSSMRNKVSKHLNQSDLMELNLMYDPMMADEKC